MNWLAHLYLSEPTPHFQIGNLLPDFLRPAEQAGVPREFFAGMAQHRLIDSFTDAHPIVRRCVQRFSLPWRRYGGILTDVFFDHFLAVEWHLHSPTPLEDFVREIDTSLRACLPLLAPSARERFAQTRLSELLCSYRELSGIELALKRLDRRLRRPVALGDSLAELQTHYEDFRSDFREFFPQLRAHVHGIERF